MPMEWLKRFLRPPQTNFHQLLMQQGEQAVIITEALQSYTKKRSDKKGQRARQIEEDADEVQRILVHELLNTFVTPIDREDLFALTRALDNFIDYVYDTVDELEIFAMDATPAIIEMTDLLHEMANELSLAIQRLLDYPGVASEHARRAKKLENQVEDVYRHSLAQMFQQPQDLQQVVQILKTREVLRHLSNAADHGDRAADTIMDIVVKWS